MIHHILYTRFNVGLYSSDSNFASSTAKKTKQTKFKNPDDTLNTDGWMEYRTQIFADFTVPSIANQDCRNFYWVILLDKKTPARHINIVNHSLLPCERTCVVICERGSHKTSLFKLLAETLHIFIDKLPINEDDIVITTKVDNDDALHSTFIGKVQSIAQENLSHKKLPFVINFPLGYRVIFPQKQIQEHSFFTTPEEVTYCQNCASLIESATQPIQTAAHSSHEKLNHSYDVIHDLSARMWMVGINECNVWRDYTVKSIPILENTPPGFIYNEP